MFLDHWVVTLTMTVITIYALFFDDIRILLAPKEADDWFFSLTLLGILLYTIELVLSSIAVENYFLSFFFWLDLVSTCSMLPDIGWFWELVDGWDNADGLESTQTAADITKTSRTSKITRVVRVIRLIRLIRVAKLYKQAKAA